MAGVIFLSLSQSILSWCALDCLYPHSAFVSSGQSAQWTQEPTYTTYFFSPIQTSESPESPDTQGNRAIKHSLNQPLHFPHYYFIHQQHLYTKYVTTA